MITLGQVEHALRFRHPAYSVESVPAVVLARELTLRERALVMKASARLETYLAQSCSILLDLNRANDPGTAGAGTSGGLPATAVAGVVSVQERSAGLAVQLNDDEDAIVVRQAERQVSAATATTLDATGAGWTVNEHATRLLRLKHGPGWPREQTIDANDADTLTGLTFDELPTTDTTFDIIDVPTLETNDLGVVTGLPALGTRVGYLVRLNSSGVAYIDYTQPLVARVEQGVPLPPHFRLLEGGTVRLSATNVIAASSDLPATGSPAAPFEIIPYRHRHDYAGFAGYVLGGSMYLVGDSASWGGVASIELQYVPIPPGVTASRDALFLLPDPAFDTLVAHAEVIAAKRVKAMGKGGDIDLVAVTRDAMATEAVYLDSISGQKRATTRRSRRNR